MGWEGLLVAVAAAGMLQVVGDQVAAEQPPDEQKNLDYQTRDYYDDSTAAMDRPSSLSSVSSPPHPTLTSPSSPTSPPSLPSAPPPQPPSLPAPTPSAALWTPSLPPPSPLTPPPSQPSPPRYYAPPIPRPVRTRAQNETAIAVQASQTLYPPLKVIMPRLTQSTPTGLAAGPEPDTAMQLYDPEPHLQQAFTRLPDSREMMGMLRQALKKEIKLNGGAQKLGGRKKKTDSTPKYPKLAKFPVNATMARCYVCGMTQVKIPEDRDCSDSFASDLVPLTPMTSAMKNSPQDFVKKCKYKRVNPWELAGGHMRGPWSGGCSYRWVDLSGVYTQRSCRSRERPALGKHFVSKRMAKLEAALVDSTDACISSPAAVLVPFSRSVSLFVRFHACVCSADLCNAAPPAARAHAAWAWAAPWAAWGAWRGVAGLL